MQLLVRAHDHPRLQDALSNKMRPGGTTVSVVFLKGNQICLTAMGDTRVCVIRVDKKTDKLSLVVFTKAHKHKGASNPNTPRQVTSDPATHPINETSTCMCETIEMDKDGIFTIVVGSDGTWDNLEDDTRPENHNHGALRIKIEQMATDSYIEWRQDPKNTPFVHKLVTDMATAIYARSHSFKNDDITLVGAEVGPGFEGMGVQPRKNSSYHAKEFRTPHIAAPAQRIGGYQFHSRKKDPAQGRAVMHGVVYTPDDAQPVKRKHDRLLPAAIEPRKLARIVVDDPPTHTKNAVEVCRNDKELDPRSHDRPMFHFNPHKNAREMCRTCFDDGSPKNPNKPCFYFNRPGGCSYAHHAMELATHRHDHHRQFDRHHHDKHRDHHDDRHDHHDRHDFARY